MESDSLMSALIHISELNNTQTEETHTQSRKLQTPENAKFKQYIKCILERTLVVSRPTDSRPYLINIIGYKSYNIYSCLSCSSSPHRKSTERIMDEVTSDTHCPDDLCKLVWNGNHLESLLFAFLFVPQLTPRQLDTKKETHLFQSFIPSLKKYLLCDYSIITS